jgi:hypothetical protein
MRHRADSTAKEIAENLRSVKPPFSVAFISSSSDDSGIPDTVIGRHGLTHLLELKALGGRLSKDQIDFMMRWKGCVHLAHSSWEATIALEACEAAKKVGHVTKKIGLGA